MPELTPEPVASWAKSQDKGYNDDMRSVFDIRSSVGGFYMFKDILYLYSVRRGGVLGPNPPRV